ncbi:T9SS type A sorting domain-containing protein [Chryseobacterium sp. SC28]|uniref:T9SS type A sorting domain-containing protein n=1 Tax=Chryseobacterium sp. SC28 TaxID=2268028 RepID=UPI000F6556F5|nr:T9SS type A sorting domain-containing protein [Chryseobacterium sp. SC28]RRQ45323.1 T9SS C-terminal target domain-containing protein [Chryseobacterium sp. SC28]
MGGTYYLGDRINSGGTWYYNYEIGQSSWNSSEAGIGQNADGTTGWDWAAAFWYEDGSGSNKRVRRDIGNFRFTNTGAWFVVGRARANAGDAWTYSDDTWNNNTTLTASTTAGNCSYFDVKQLENPVTNAYNCTSATNQITLNWSKWNSKDVIILRNTTGTFTNPTQGTAYDAGNTIGGSEVIYRGNQTSFTDTIVPGQTYYYKFYSENHSYYSGGVVQSPVKLETITTSPSSQTVDLYAATTPLTITTGIAGITSYQWYRNATNSNAGGIAIPGATDSTYVPDSYTAGSLYYYLLVSTGAGSCDKAVSNVSMVTVNSSNTADWANIQYPKKELDTFEGIGIDVFAQVYISGSTPGPGEANPPTQAWIGYSPTNSNPNTWPESQWQTANFNTSQAYLTDNNDEYWISKFGQNLPLGTYYIASRFRKQGETAFVYGGTEDTSDPLSGGIWNGTTYKSLKLNINKTITWNANVGATAGEWNNGTGPVITSPAIIATHLTSPTESFTAKTLTINDGVSLTIPSGNYVKVQDAITNYNTAAPGIILESDANLIQVTNVSVNGNTGKMLAKRDVTDMDNVLATQMDYVYWSSPVSGQATTGSAGFSPGTPASRFFEYRESNDTFYGTLDTTFKVGKGYAVRAEVSAAYPENPTGYNKTYTFTGVPNNGDYSISLQRSNESGSGGIGYNLIGNPYPSNIDFEKLYAGNSDLIYNTAYFWTNNGYTKTQMGSNYTGNNYAVYNGTGGNAATQAAGGSGLTAVPNGIVKVGQGFIVQKKSVGSGLLNFKNSYGTGQDLRVTSPGTFFEKNGSETPRFWIRLTSPSLLANTQLIGYINGASNGFDPDYDAELLSMSSDIFYSVLGSRRLLIQGRSPGFTTEDVVPLGANYYEAGVYKISLENKEGIFASTQKIYLRDKLLNTYTDLTTEDYSFTTSKGTDETRFEIVYKDNVVLGTDAATKSDFEVYRDGDYFVIKSAYTLGKIELYDASGRMVLTTSSKDKTARIDASALANGFYIIKAENSGKMRTRKIIK